jgi:hypothetical protein
MSARSLRERLALVAGAMDVSIPSEANTATIIDALVAGAPAAEDRWAYLLLAVLDGTIPESHPVVTFRRVWGTQGLGQALGPVIRRARLRPFTTGVRIASDIIVDVTDTAATSFTTGIQRVARESLTRWPAERLELVVWRRGRLQSVTDEQRLRAVPNSRTAGSARPGDVDVVVPFGATYVLPEIAVNSDRANRIRSLARHSGCRTLAIGFDCIPMTSAEVVAPAMPGAFANYLSTLADFDEVVPISGASEEEFAGWRRMLRGAGLEGPRLHTVSLPFAAQAVDPALEPRVRKALGIPADQPIVLSVGSHEPRKNHVTLLEAAELLWREGDEFTVVIVGGNAWDTLVFDELLASLRAAGRRIVTPSGVDDDTVWTLYRSARFSVFCSYNEGFGLPVAESLASGTPVVTSGFGSMRELAEGHGGVLVDPRDARGIADVMRTLLRDDDALAALHQEIETLPTSSWDQYADALWSRVTGIAVTESTAERI